MISKEMLEKCRNGSDPVIVEKVEELARLLEVALLQYMHRPESKEKILTLVHNFLGKLDHSLRFGDSRRPLGKLNLKEVLATLVGARMALTPRRDRHVPGQEPLYHATLAAKFLELVSRKVGSINLETGKATILMTVNPNQDGWSVVVPRETYQ